ncbi:MAG: response regulator [Terracidiphilus sp.]
MHAIPNLQEGPLEQVIEGGFSAGESMAPKSSVMIVDDNPVHLELYRMILEQAGFRGVPVLVSYGGMQLPDDESVDAVLLDYRLGPHISGYNAVLQVKERYPTAPILLLSDLYDPPTEAVPHVHAFVRKGNPEDLLAALRGVLNKPV